MLIEFVKSHTLKNDTISYYVSVCLSSAPWPL
jgi:hypothetical protein